MQDAVHLLAMLCLGTGEFDRALAFRDEAYAANETLGNATETFAVVTTQNVIHLRGAAFSIRAGGNGIGARGFGAGGIMRRVFGGKISRATVTPSLAGRIFFRARIALAQGDKVEATRELEQALQLSDEMGARRDLWGICWTLAGLETEQGNVEGAEYLRERARAAIMYVAEHVGASELQATFLARPDVQAVMRAAHAYP